MKQIKDLYRLYFTINVKKTLKNTFYISLSEIFIKIISFLWIIYLARNLIIADYGTYSYVNTFIVVFALLPDLGTGLIIIREIARNPKKANLIIGNAFYINFGLSLLTFVLIVFASFVLGVSYEIKILLLLASFTLFFSIIRSLGIFYFEGTEKMKHSAFLNSVNSLFLILGGLFGYSLGYGLEGIFFGMLLGTIISLIVTWLTTSRFIIPKFKFDPVWIRFLLKSGIPLGLAGLASVIYLRVDTIIIGQLLGQKAVGIYSAATPLVIALSQLIIIPFMISVYPVLTRLFKSNYKSFKNGIFKATLLILIITLPVTFFAYFLSGEIISILFNGKYDDSIPILKTLVLFIPFIAMISLLYRIIIILGKQIYYLYVSIFGVIISVTLTSIMVTNLGLIGAAISQVITQITIFLIFLAFVIRFLNEYEKK